MIPSILDFIRTKVRVGKQLPQDEGRLSEEEERRARNARTLLTSDVFIEAYQDELADIVDALLRLDMEKSEHRRTALGLLARAQELQALARKLAGYVNAAESRRAISHSRERAA